MRPTSFCWMLLVAALAAPEARGELTLRWTYACPDACAYVVRMDAPDRATGIVDVFPTFATRKRLSTVTYELSDAPRKMPQRPSPELRAFMESPSGESGIFFAPATQYEYGSVVLPVASATRYDAAGEPQATYRNILDVGRLSDDGSVFVSFASGPGSLREGLTESVLDTISWHDRSGARVGSVVDALMDPLSAELSADGSLFVYARRGGDVVGHGPFGDRLFVRENQDAYFAGHPRFAVTPSGSRVAYQMGKSVESTYPPQPVIVLDRAGTMRASVTVPAHASHLGLSDDGSRLLVLRPDALRAFDASTGSLAWSWSPMAGHALVASAVRASAGPTVAVSYSADPDGGPVDVRVAAISSAGEGLGSFSSNGESPLMPGSYMRQPGVWLSADGAFLLVALDRKMWLFTIE